MIIKAEPTAYRQEYSHWLLGDGSRLIGAVVNTCDADANAAFIVRAVNSHETLLAALRSFVDYYDQAGIGDCSDPENDDNDDHFDGDERFNVRQALAAIAAAQETKGSNL